MKNTKKSLEEPFKQILNYKPKEVPTKPSKQPSKAQLEQVFKYENGRIIEVK